MADIDLDALTQRITKALRGAPRPAIDDDEEPVTRGGGRSSETLIATMKAEIKALRAREVELAQNFADYQAGAKADAAKIREDAAGQVAGLAQRNAEDLTLVQHGVADPLGRDTVRRAWESQPKDARGKSAADWWAQQVAATKAAAADPKLQAPEVPAPLRGYLPAVEAPKAAGTRSDATGQPRSPWGGSTVDRGTAPATAKTGLEAFHAATDFDAAIAALARG